MAELTTTTISRSTLHNVIRAFLSALLVAACACASARKVGYLPESERLQWVFVDSCSYDWESDIVQLAMPTELIAVTPGQAFDSAGVYFAFRPAPPWGPAPHDYHSSIEVSLDSCGSFEMIVVGIGDTFQPTCLGTGRFACSSVTAKGAFKLGDIYDRYGFDKHYRLIGFISGEPIFIMPLRRQEFE